jgi:hypothetical protein
MRKYSSNLAFVDLLFNLLIGFTCLLVLAFLLINPIADEGKIDPVSEFIITFQWDENSPIDIDGWVKGPEGTVVGFRAKDGQWMVLERDDLGIDNDYYVVNGETRILKRNIETISINAKVPGEYTVNVHNYSHKSRKLPKNEQYPTPVRIDIIKLNPYRLVLTEYMNISDIRTDIQVPIFYKFAATGNTDPGDTSIQRLEDGADPTVGPRIPTIIPY